MKIRHFLRRLLICRRPGLLAQRLLLQAKEHGQAGYDHAKEGAHQKRGAMGAETEARKDAARAQYAH